MAYAKQHHVSVHILKNFTDNANRFYYYNKAHPEKGVQRKNPENVFYRRHQYSIENADGSRDVQIESKFLKKLDNDVNPILLKIITSVRHNEVPSLTNEEKEFWDFYFLTQHFRSPDVLLSEQTRRMSERNYINTIQEIRARVHNLFPDSVHILDCPDFIERMINNTPRQTLITNREQPMQALRCRGLYFGRVKNIKKSLVIGSQPVMRYNSNGSNHLKDERTEMWFSVSHDVMVSPGANDLTFKLLNIPDSFVSKQNYYIHKQSQEIGGCSDLLLKSVSRPR